MDLTRTPSQIAHNAAEEIRALNHRTLNTGTYSQPGDVSDTANAVLALLERLPQALDQMEAGLLVLKGQNRIRLDTKPLGDTSPAEISTEVFMVASALSHARRMLRQAHAEMQEATGRLSHMGGLWEDGGEDEGAGA